MSELVSMSTDVARRNKLIEYMRAQGDVLAFIATFPRISRNREPEYSYPQ
jgi:hypothetical protein